MIRNRVTIMDEIYMNKHLNRKCRKFSLVLCLVILLYPNDVCSLTVNNNIHFNTNCRYGCTDTSVRNDNNTNSNRRKFSMQSRKRMSIINVTNRNQQEHEKVLDMSTVDAMKNKSNRRFVLQKSISSILSSYILLGICTTSSSSISNAAIFQNNSQNHRQLELCLISIIRVILWAQYEIEQIDNSIMNNDESNNNDATSNIDQQQRNIYIETRIGAKAALTGRISSSGATSRDYILTTLQVSECLQDLQYYYTTKINQKSKRNNKNSIEDLCTNFREGLAYIVEFDGLDTLTDPSPRLTLTIAQYNYDKLKFIRRILQERVIPDGQQLVSLFGDDAYQRSIGYIQQYYSNELPRTTKLER